MTAPSGDRVLTAVRHSDVRALLNCPYGSRDLTAPGLPRLVGGAGVDDVPGVLINLDPPAHTRQRQILRGAFTVTAAERWRAPCRDLAHDLLDGVRGPAMDVVADYALPLSSAVICQVLGVPPGDRERFGEWISAFLSASTASSQDRAQAYAGFMSYGAELVAAHRAAPGHDLVDDLIQARDGGDRLSDDELVNVLFMLITAGHETTALMVSRGVYRLLLHPDEYRRLVVTPSLIRPAVEEILRYDGPGSPGLLRRLTEDLELPSGAVVPAGTVVLPHLSAANHDPDAFGDPERFDITRYAPGMPTRPHLAFGHGAHFCLGQALARMVLQEALSALVLRAPWLRPAVPLDEVRWSTWDLTLQPVRLPVLLT
ncbi:cytochrome P450 [Nonomuraea aridisoli]|uniref:Cytochrome P450 n=2 Tax=Nonomuraea aridisoli TaxID=2070368 RepID=A0A2W2DZ43_9ACTN|nr:cytochrome P450 [Nonomuraea aridisoli]